MKHYLVTGGKGFIGSHCVTALLEQGHNVTVIDFSSEGFRYVKQGVPYHKVQVITENVANEAIWSTLLKEQEFDGVLHLAAQTSAPLSVEKPLESMNSNIKGFLLVLDYVKKNALPFVYASSAAVYGNLGETKADDMVAPAYKPLSPYGLEKYIDEQYADLYYRLHQTPSVGLRYFNVFGEGQDPSSSYSGVISRFCEAFRQDNPHVNIYGDGLQTRDFIHVSDVVSASLAALSYTEHAVFNVATGHSVCLLEVLVLLEAISGESYQIQYHPRRLGDIRFSSASVSKIHQAGLLPEILLPLKQGLERLYNWSV